jgi:ubiquinone/menaquinone biosynthesis C-methylase UbiE
VFCTIPDPKKALEEIQRVCKPDGHVLLFEHVKIDHPVLGSLQEWLTPLWKRLCDGCHLNRRTLEWVKQAGFKTTNVQRYYKDLFVVVEAINKKTNNHQTSF